MKLNRKILITALIASCSAGIYYMGKSALLNKLKEDGYVTEIIDENGKVNNVLTDKGQNSAVAKLLANNTNSNAQNKMFDYNNPQYHADANYFLKQSTGTFLIPNKDKNGNLTGEFTEVTVEKDGKIEPTFTESIKQGTKSVIDTLIFWR